MHSRYLARRTLILKLFVLLYTAFNSQIGFPRVLDAMPPGDRGCSVPFMLRYINAQPLLTSCVVTMVTLLITLLYLAGMVKHQFAVYMS